MMGKEVISNTVKKKKKKITESRYSMSSCPESQHFLAFTGCPSRVLSPGHTRPVETGAQSCQAEGHLTCLLQEAASSPAARRHGPALPVPSHPEGAAAFRHSVSVTPSVSSSIPPRHLFHLFPSLVIVLHSLGRPQSSQGTGSQGSPGVLDT